MSIDESDSVNGGLGICRGILGSQLRIGVEVTAEVRAEACGGERGECLGEQLGLGSRAEERVLRLVPEGDWHSLFAGVMMELPDPFWTQG